MRSLSLVLFALLLIAVGFLAFAIGREPEVVPSSSHASTDRGLVVPSATATPPAFGSTLGSDEASGASEPSAKATARNQNIRALELLDSGAAEKAVELLESCVELDPDELVFQYNLAEALARIAAREHESNDPAVREQALAKLERASSLHPDREDLTRALDRWRKSVTFEREFWRKVTDHFELSFDGTRDELMWGTAPLENELESAYHEFGEAFGFFPVEEGRPLIRVVLYRREAFDSVTGLGDWAGGVFDGTVRVPVEDLGQEVERLKTVLRHELMHAFIREAGGTDVPGWLNEGLAQWLESNQPGIRRAAVENACRELKGHQLFALADLRGSLTHLDPDQISLAYAQSIGFIAHIAETYGDRILFQMVAGCAAGDDPGVTFGARVGVPLQTVCSDFAALQDC